MSKQLLKLLLLIITATPLSAMAESVPSKNQIKEFIQSMPFDFEQIEHDESLIQLDLEKKRKRFRVIEVSKNPTKQQLRKSIIIHTLDVATTIYALENRDHVREGNIILGPDPEIYEVVLLKAIVLPFVHQNFESGQILIMNWAGGIAVVNNLYIINRYD